MESLTGHGGWYMIRNNMYEQINSPDVKLLGSGLIKCIIQACSWVSSSFGGVGALVGGAGVGGALVPRRFRRQKPAFGPFMTNASVHRDRPRRVSGRWMAAARSVDKDRMNINLPDTYQGSA